MSAVPRTILGNFAEIPGISWNLSVSLKWKFFRIRRKKAAAEFQNTKVKRVSSHFLYNMFSNDSVLVFDIKGSREWLGNSSPMATSFHNNGPWSTDFLEPLPELLLREQDLWAEPMEIDNGLWDSLPSVDEDRLWTAAELDSVMFSDQRGSFDSDADSADSAHSAHSDDTLSNGLYMERPGTYRFYNRSAYQVRDLWIPVGFRSALVRDGVVFQLSTRRIKGPNSTIDNEDEGDFVGYRLTMVMANASDAILFKGSSKGADTLGALVKEGMNVVLDNFPELEELGWSRNGMRSVWEAFGLRSVAAQNEERAQYKIYIANRRARERLEDEQEELQQRMRQHLGDAHDWVFNDVVLKPTKKQRKVVIDLTKE